jgi:AcrR family transcriptional regulator
VPAPRPASPGAAARRRRPPPSPAGGGVLATVSVDDEDGVPLKAAGPPGPEELNAPQRARRLRIVRAGLGLLEERPYEAVQMRDVAVAAEVALGTVYRYFASKEQLFAAVLLEWAGPFADRPAAVPAAPEADGGETDAERLVAALYRAVTAFEHRPQFYKVVTMLQLTTEPEVVATYRRFAAHVHDALAETLRDVPPDQVDDVVALAEAVLDAVLRAWSLDRITVDEARHRLARSVDLVFSPPPRRRRP